MSIRASKEAVYKGLNEPTLEAAITGQMKYPAIGALFRSSSFQKGETELLIERTRAAFPGVDALPADAQGALVSLVYNRGPGMTGETLAV